MTPLPPTLSLYPLALPLTSYAAPAGLDAALAEFDGATTAYQRAEFDSAASLFAGAAELMREALPTAVGTRTVCHWNALLARLSAGDRPPQELVERVYVGDPECYPAVAELAASLDPP